MLGTHLLWRDQDRVDVDEERLYAGHLWVRVGWGVFG